MSRVTLHRPFMVSLGTLRTLAPLALILGAALLASACGAEEESAPCNGMPFEQYQAGMAKTTDQQMFNLSLSADSPEPHEWVNVFTVDVTDASGQPVSGATLAFDPYMPDMGHGSPGDIAVAEMEPGKYQVTDVVLMKGLWEFTIDVTDAAGTTDRAMFTLCVTQDGERPAE